MHELEHHFLQLTFRSLPVTYDDTRPGHQGLQLGGDLPDAFHAVVHEIDLTFALELLLDGGLDRVLVTTGYHGLNCDSILGWGLNHTHVAQPDHGHVQRARNRSGRHGEHVHLLTHLFQPLLVSHPEALFFVDDQEAEIGKLHVFREQTVSTDQDVHFAGFDFLENFLLLFRGAEAADHFDRDREGRKTLLERFVMLESEDSCGRQHSNLFVVADGLEGGAHGDFRFAVANVAAE